MNRTLTISAIALIAVVMVAGTIIPVIAPIAVIPTAIGEITSINPSGKHGVIERTDDDSKTLYQFNIPRDLADSSYDPKVGDVVPFSIDPENSRHATNVNCVPPNICGSGGGD